MATLTPQDRILVTGGTGLIGRNLTQALRERGCQQVISVGSSVDMRQAQATDDLFAQHQPTVVFHLAARVGGIYANANYKAGFYADNVLINTHVVQSCINHGVRYIFAMGTGCAYPKRLEGHLLSEDTFLDGIPEVTNDAYAYAKRGLLVHLQALAEQDAIRFCYCLPANIYGPYDNFHPKHSHVVPALVRRFCEAVDDRVDSVAIWGDGQARRDFLYVEDCVDAMILLADQGVEGVVNVATGETTSIADLAALLKLVTDFPGEIQYDTSYPSGQQVRLMDMTKMHALDWRPNHDLKQGLHKTVEWFRSHRHEISER